MSTESNLIEDRLPLALLLMRIAVFFVMAIWSLDKILNPAHADAVFENFYFISGLGTGVFIAIGVIQLIVEIGFLLGLYKTWTYGYVLVFHAISTASSWQQHLSPLEPGNMLFQASIPMLAACIALFMLRDADRRWSLG